MNLDRHLRPLLATTLATTLLSCAAPYTATRPAMRVRLVAESTIPHDTRFAGTVVGGLSGIDLGPDGTWYLICDDRSALGPARFYTATIDPATARVALTGVATMKDSGGAEFARGMVDPEAIRSDPDAGTIWWTSEGDEAREIDPFIREMRRDGSFVREIPLPEMFRMDSGGSRGPQNNAVFEALAISHDLRSIIVALEEGLKQERPHIGRGVPAPSRISFFDRRSGRLTRQVMYQAERAPATDTSVGGNGVVEILAIDERWLLVLERAYTPGLGNTVRLFAVDPTPATNVAGIESTPGLLPVYSAKVLVADLGTLGLSKVDNIEGMSWGPPLADGRRTLVLVSDNNFNPSQVTQVIVLAVEM